MITLEFHYTYVDIRSINKKTKSFLYNQQEIYLKVNFLDYALTMDSNNLFIVI